MLTNGALVTVEGFVFRVSTRDCTSDQIRLEPYTWPRIARTTQMSRRAHVLARDVAESICTPTTIKELST